MRNMFDVPRSPKIRQSHTRHDEGVYAKCEHRNAVVGHLGSKRSQGGAA